MGRGLWRRSQLADICGAEADWRAWANDRQMAMAQEPTGGHRPTGWVLGLLVGVLMAALWGFFDGCVDGNRAIRSVADSAGRLADWSVDWSGG